MLRGRGSDESSHQLLCGRELTERSSYNSTRYVCVCVECTIRFVYNVFLTTNLLIEQVVSELCIYLPYIYKNSHLQVTTNKSQPSRERKKVASYPEISGQISNSCSVFFFVYAVKVNSIEHYIPATLCYLRFSHWIYVLPLDTKDINGSELEPF